MQKLLTLWLLTFTLTLQFFHLSADHSREDTRVAVENASKETLISPPKEGEPVFPLNIEEPAKQNDKFFTEFMNMLATLGLIIVLIFLVAWFFKRLMTSRLENLNSSSLIRVVERRALSPKTALYLLEVDTKTILVAETPGGIVRLSEFETGTTEEAPSPSSEFPSPFRQMLERKKDS